MDISLAQIIESNNGSLHLATIVDGTCVGLYSGLEQARIGCALDMMRMAYNTKYGVTITGKLSESFCYGRGIGESEFSDDAYKAMIAAGSKVISTYDGKAIVKYLDDMGIAGKLINNIPL